MNLFWKTIVKVFAGLIFLVSLAIGAIIQNYDKDDLRVLCHRAGIENDQCRIIINPKSENAGRVLITAAS